MSIFTDTNILINEVKMNDVELLKPNATTGEDRTDILLKRIEAGETLEGDDHPWAETFEDLKGEAKLLFEELMAEFRRLLGDDPSGVGS